MRYGPILLLSMSPLLGLTVWGFVRLAMDDPTQLPPELAPAERQEAAIQPTEALEKAAAAKKRTNSAQGIVEQLASCGLCGLHSEAFADALAKLGKISPSDPLSQEWRSVSDTWTGSIKARQALDQFQPVAEAISKLPTAPSSRQDKAGMEKYRVKVEELKGTVQRCANDWNARYASVLGSQVIHDRLQTLENELGRRKDDVGAMIEDLAKVQKAESDVQDAIRLMTNDHDPAGCLRKLDLIQLSLLPDSATKQDLESRVRRARGMGHYLVDRKSLVDGIKDTAAKARFFEKYPRPPEGTEPDIVAWHGKESLRTQLEKFAGAEDLTGLLTKAAAIVGDEYADASIKARVKQEVVKWLKSKAFTRKTVPDGLVGMEEAWTRRGDRKIGKFRLNGVQYRFWRWDGPLNITDNPLGEDAFDADSFERAPSTPMYTLWADEYNSRIDQLFLPDTTRARWDEFLRWCKDTEAKLKEYRQRWGIIQEPDRSCRDWTFLHETSIPAEDIQQHWENLRKVLQ